MKELSSSIPSVDDLIRAIGLHTRNGGTTSHMIPGLALFGAGILVGAGLALLLAPTTGEELREDLSERVDALRERVAGTSEDDTKTARTAE